MFWAAHFCSRSYRPAPFYIMDEIDAALDNENVTKVCNYIASKSINLPKDSTAQPLQCLVISLKVGF